jgi:Tfp pilus assembly protein PilF
MRTLLTSCPVVALSALLALAAADMVPGCARGAAPAATDSSVPAAPFRAPYIPAGDGENLQDVPSTADPAVATMRQLRAQWTAAPHSLPAALALAGAYTDYSRQIGDAHYAGYAEAVIAPWLAAAHPPPGVLVAEATILQYRHQFNDARALLQRALAIDAGNAQAWLTLATLDMVQGDYAAAGKDCRQVTSSAGFAYGLACTGNLFAYVGKARQSLALLQQAQAALGGAPATVTAWLEGLLAESAERLGDWPLAETHYRNALKLLPEDNFLLVAYADFLLDRGRPQEVLPLLAEHTQSDTAFLRLALARAALKTADAPRYAWIMAARFEALKLRGSDYFGREQVRFALHLEHDPQSALDLAQRNWQLQRAPWDARVLLEAALAAEQPQAAREVLQFVHETHLEDPAIAPLVQALRVRLNRLVTIRPDRLRPGLEHDPAADGQPPGARP